MNGYPADALTRLLGDWGELETPWKIANCIVRAREAAPIRPRRSWSSREALHPERRVEVPDQAFQALRIEVNGEMEALKMALEQSLKVLRPGGRLVVISYHSLEDRLVKNFLRSEISQARWRTFGRALTPFELITAQGRGPLGRSWNATPVALGQAARGRKTGERITEGGGRRESFNDKAAEGCSRTTNSTR